MARKIVDPRIHCVICGDEVPKERRVRGAITCTKEHGVERRNQLRALIDLRECRYCRHPSTPEERDAYRRFRVLESKRPDLLYPEAFEDWKASGGEPTAQSFAESRKK